MPLTYEQIVERALNYCKRNEPTFTSIEARNEPFFATFPPDEKARFIDNLYLDYFGFEQVNDTWAYTKDDIKAVYEAAKIMFARYPGEKMIYDLDSAADVFGSPWAVTCCSAEDWAIAFARLRLQNDEATISGPITQDIIDDALTLIRDDLIGHCGVPSEDILPGLSDLCWGRYVLEHAICDAMGWPKREPEEYEIQREKEENTDLD